MATERRHEIREEISRQIPNDLVGDCYSSEFERIACQRIAELEAELLQANNPQRIERHRRALAHVDALVLERKEAIRHFSDLRGATVDTNWVVSELKRLWGLDD